MSGPNEREVDRKVGVRVPWAVTRGSRGCLTAAGEN